MTKETASIDDEAWRCFHCGETFRDRDSAAAHFGPDEGSVAACVIKAGAEGSLVEALRKVERELEDARRDINDESTEAARAYYAQQTRHYDQLQAAEEAGYERGLADGQAIVSKAPAAQLSEAWRERERLVEHWKKECNRYINGQCHTRRCLIRGGYTDGPPDYGMATCEAHETVLALIEAPRTDGLREDGQ